MLSSYYDKIASTQRLQSVSQDSGSNPGDANQKTYSEYLTGIDCLVQPVDASITPDVEGGFGKDFLMMCDVVDILDTDRIVIGGDVYRIVGIEKHSFLGNSHLELLIRIFQTYGN